MGDVEITEFKLAVDGFVDWCNKNQGFLTFILALVAFITISITGLLMRKSNKLSQENISQAFELELQRSRPHLIMSITHEDVREEKESWGWDLEKYYFTHLKVKNVGLTPAYNVVIRSDPELMGVTSDGENRVSGLINNEISIIAPNQEMSDCLCQTTKFQSTYKSKLFKFHLDYTDLFGNNCGHDLILDQSYKDNVISTKITSSGEEPIENKIYQALLNIDMTLSSIASNSNISAKPVENVLNKLHEKLLLDLVNAYKKLSSDETNLFIVSSVISKKVWGSYIIHHPGFEGGEYDVEFDKLLSLERLGCISRASSASTYSSSSFTFYITPEGFRYSEKISQS